MSKEDFFGSLFLGVLFALGIFYAGYHAGQSDKMAEAYGREIAHISASIGRE